MPLASRRGGLGYVVAAGSVAAAIVNIELMDTAAPVATFVLAVIVSTWFGGTRPGILATALAIPALIYYLPPPGSFDLDVRQFARILYFCVIAGFIIWVIASERRAAERLGRREDRLRTVIDSIPAMVWILGRDGKLEYVNRPWLDYTGLSLREALDRTQRTIHPEDYERVMDKWRGALAAGAAYDDEMRLRGADGEYRWFLVRTVPQRADDATIVHWYGTSTDIEGRRRAEKELSDVIDTMPVSAWTARADGQGEFTNRAVQAYTGLRPDQTRGWGWQAAVHPDDLDRHRARWMKSVATGEPFETETRYRRADGAYRWHLVRAVPLRDEHGQILRWYGMIADIDDRKRAEERLQQLSHRLLEVQEQERRHLARELHDEAGQLLTAISLHMHAARSAEGALARKNLDRAIELLESAGERLRNLAVELHPPMLENAGLDAALRWLASQHRGQAGIAIHIGGDTRGVAGDAALTCFRVAQEALTNVVKHARARNAWIDFARRDAVLELAVRDDGVGFDVADTLGRAAGEGRLGLLGMRERVQILGGSLQVESQPGQGTCIRISLAVRRDAVRSRHSRSGSRVPAPSDRSQQKSFP